MEVKHFETLVYKAHFDAEMKTINRRFDEIDQRFEKIDLRFDKTEDRLSPLGSMIFHVNLQSWMLGLIILVLIVPELQRWFAPV